MAWSNRSFCWSPSGFRSKSDLENDIFLPCYISKGHFINTRICASAWVEEVWPTFWGSFTIIANILASSSSVRRETSNVMHSKSAKPGTALRVVIVVAGIYYIYDSCQSSTGESALQKRVRKMFKSPPQWHQASSANDVLDVLESPTSKIEKIIAVKTYRIVFLGQLYAGTGRWSYGNRVVGNPRSVHCIGERPRK